MNKISFLQKIDLFGAPYFPIIQEQRTFYRTTIGGLFTLILYTLSLAYCLYIFVLWKNGSLLPKTTSQQLILNNYTYQLSSKMFQMNYNQANQSWQPPSKVFPLQKFDNIITPILINVQPQKKPLYKILFQNTNQPYLEDQNFSISIVNGINTQCLIYFSQCKPSIFQKFNETSAKCSNNEVIDQFMESPQILLELIFNLDFFDQKLQSLQQYHKKFYFVLNKNISIYNIVRLKLSEVNYKNGIIFEDRHHLEFISDIEITSQPLPIEQMKKYTLQDAYIMFFIQIDPIALELNIGYPLLGEVLAQIGSIVSTIFFFRIIVVMMNASFLQKKIIQDTMLLYYPEIKEFVIKKKCFRKIIKKKTNDEVNKEEIQKQYNLIYFKAQQKLNILNQIKQIYKIKCRLKKIDSLLQVIKETQQQCKKQILDQKYLEQIITGYQIYDQQLPDPISIIESSNRIQKIFV